MADSGYDENAPALPELQPGGWGRYHAGMERHRLSEVDAEARTATCSVCGSAVRIRYRAGGRSECLTARQANRGRPSSEAKRRQNLKARYDLTPEQVRLLDADGDTCPICRRSSRRLYVDHDHACCPGRISCGSCVRGAICTDCNLGLARFGDSPEALERAAAYLRR